MKKNELKVLQILAEIQNPDKIISDMAKQFVFLATERAKDRHDPVGREMSTSDIKKQIEYYMDHLHTQIDKQLK